VNIEDLLIAVVTYVVSIYFFVASFKLPAMSGSYPRYIALVVILLNTLSVVKSLPRPGKTERTNIVPDSLDPNGLKHAVYMLVATGVYVGLMSVVGFFVMTALFLLTTLWIFNVRKPSTLIFVTVFMLSFIFIGFKLIFGVPIPQGILI
jgi:putative tricarboxylic transport membrane protein